MFISFLSFSLFLAAKGTVHNQHPHHHTLEFITNTESQDLYQN